MNTCLIEGLPSGRLQGLSPYIIEGLPIGGLQGLSPYLIEGLPIGRLESLREGAELLQEEDEVPALLHGNVSRTQLQE